MKAKNHSLIAHIAGSRKLILQLARNDSKKKFAGSYLGVFWAFVQPVITVLLYWFVFEKGLHQRTTDLRSGIEVPFVLWLTGGLVPWFYFQESVTGGTGVLVEYDYLVKKVVFQIDVLPVVKLISALFTHLFFIVFTVLLYLFYGYGPDLYTLQVIYYSVCMMVLAAGVVYATSAVTVFFRDMKEVVAIILQVGIWVTPIMWSFESMSGMPEWALALLRINPMYYVVAGYRDALINKVWFWENPGQTAVFWAVTVLFLLFGSSVFRRLRPHFADVL